MMKILLAAALIMISPLLWAQDGNGKISGVVIDGETNKPVEFATIAVEDPATGKPVTGTVADDKGKFSVNKIPNGTYRVVISFIGYENNTINGVVIGDKKSIDLGNQKLNTATKQLDEVVVEGQRALVEEKVDRMIYNAENDATTKGGDGTDVLRRVPMLTVDMDGNVSMRGNSNIRVLINGKPSSIAASSVSDALKQIPADEIKSVEVITSPSAKYDAEGSAGIINIITKKSNISGFSLGVDGSAGFRGSNLGLNGSLRTGKMGFSLGGFGRSNYNVTGKFNNTQVTGWQNPETATTLTQNANTLNRGLFGNYNLGWDYDINKYNSLTASVRIGARNGRNFQNDMETQTLFPTGLFNNNLRDVDTKDNSENVDASLTYLRTFETVGRELSFMGSFNRNNRINNSYNSISMVDNAAIDSIVRNGNKSYNQEATIQVDYATPLAKKHIVELGAKNISRTASSKYNYTYALNGGDYQTLERAGLNNGLDYNQNVTAGYLAFTFSLPKSISLKAGSRYEYTTINAEYASAEKVTIPSYGVLVPSINLSKKLSNGNTLKIAYNRRIQRPSIQYLNPNVQIQNGGSSVTIGNPTLAPEYTNNYELSYSTLVKTTSLNFSAFVRNTTQAIQSVRDTTTFNDIHGVARTQYFNIGKEDAYGGSVFANIALSNKFSLNGGTDVYYAVLNNNNPDPNYAAKNEGFVYNVRMFGNYNFAPLYGFQFFGFYRGRDVQLQGFRGGFAMYSLSLKRDFAEKKGSVGVGVENFFNFNGWKVKSETTTPTIMTNSVNVMNNLSFKVTFSYRIGKMTVGQPKRRKSITNDDLKGEGGGDGGGMDNGGGQQQGGGAGGQRGMGQQGGARQTTATPNLKMDKADPTAKVNAEGSWTYTVESPQGGNGKIVIKKEGDKYTGTISNNRNPKETPLSSVIVNGNEIDITYEVSFNGNTMPVTIKGTIKEDDLNGMMSVGQFGTFPINGKREKQ